MPGLLDLEDHLAFYRSYHMNKVNVTIHLMCIPMIYLSTLAFLVPVNVGPVNMSIVIAWLYGIYYILLDWKLGLIGCGISVGFAVRATTYYYQTLEPGFGSITTLQFVNYAIAIHIASWLAQFYGHGVHERRAPALLHNLLQALVLAPFFVLFEAAFALGFRKDLERNMNSKAGVRVRDFRAAQKEALEKKAE